MRWIVVAALLLTPGCFGDDAAVAPLFSDDIDVPAGLYAFADFSLDLGESIEWSWTSDQPVAFDGRLRCATQETQTGGPSTAGSGSFTGTSHGCIAELIWTRTSMANNIHVTVRGDGHLLQSGTETGE